MKKDFKFLAAVATSMLTLALCGACNNPSGDGSDADTEAPVITLSADVPTSGYNGKAVKLPTATAMDNVDGDLSESVKVTVNAYNEEGEVVAEPVYNKAANSERSFKPSANHASYKIIYFVTDEAGNKAELSYVFNAQDDTVAPTLTLDPAFETTKGITVAADKEFTLPTATGVDLPLNDDLTSSIEIRVTDEDGDLVSIYKNGGVEHKDRIVAGEYTVTYSLKDGAKNTADPISFPLTVTHADYSKNLLKEENMALGVSSELNEYGWLTVGKNSLGGAGWDTAQANFSLVHFKEEYVGLTFNIDPPSEENPEFMYHIGSVGHQMENEYAPNSDYPWQTYMFIRFTESGVAIYSDSVSSAGNSDTYQKCYFDGQDHTMFFRYDFSEATETEVASITLSVWIDCVPTETATLSWTLKCAEDEVSDKTANALAKSEFEALFASKGWLNFMSYTANGSSLTCGDDKITVKSIFVYENAEDVDAGKLAGPTLTLSSEVMERYAVNEEATIPTATWTGAANGTAERKLYAADGTEIALGDATTYTFTNTGIYKLVYAAANEAGVYTVKEIRFKAIVSDDELPVITVDETEINATLGSWFNIPTATVSDNIDGDITDKMTVTIDGVSYQKGIVNGGSVMIKAVGEHYIIYTVTDEAGNVATKSVKVNVTKDASLGAGNVIANEASNILGTINGGYLTLPAGDQALAGYNGHYIYDQKVSMLINGTDTASGLFLINMRGISTSAWQIGSGLVLSFYAPSSMVRLSFGGWDKNVLAEGSGNLGALCNGKDALLEFQVTDVTVEGAECVQIRVWINKTEVTFTPKEGMSAVGADGGIVATKSLVGKAAYAGNLTVSVPTNGMPFVGVIKDLRVDGSDIEFTPPKTEFDVTFNAPTITNKNVTLSAASAPQDLLSCSGNKQLVTLKITQANYSATQLNGIGITGTSALNKEWMLNGFGIRLWEGNVSITYGTHNNHLAVSYGTVTNYVSDSGKLEMYLAYSLEYDFDENGDLLGVWVRVYAGTSVDELTKLTFVNPSNDNYASGVTEFDVTDGVYIDVAKLTTVNQSNLSAPTVDALNQSVVYAVCTTGYVSNVEIEVVSVTAVDAE